MATSPVNFSMLDPSMAADQMALERNMALAQALRQQSMTPIDTNGRMAGAVMSRVSPFEGLAKMLQGYNAGKWNEQNDADRMALAQKQSALLSALVGRPSTPEAASTAALANGAAQGDVGPTLGNAARMDAGQSGQGAMSVTGDPGRDRLLMALNPDKYMETYLSKYGATDASKAAAQGGFSPVVANQQAFTKSVTDPKVYGQQQAGLTPQQIQAAALGEAAKGAEIERKSGNQFVNPVLNASGIVPKIPEGANPVGSVAPNGALPGGVTPMPGAAPIMQNNAQASSSGTASGQLHEVTLKDGSKVLVPGSAIAPAAGSTQVPAAVQTARDAERLDILKSELGKPEQRAGDHAAILREIKRQFGQSTADKITQEAGGKLTADLPMQIQQSKQTVVGLENAYKTIEALDKSGPGVSRAVNALGIVNNLGIPLAKGDTNGYQTLKKFLENSASTAASSNGFTGSDARFEQFKAGQPNAETMNADALKGAIRYVLSQHDAAIARGQFIQQQAQANPNDPNATMKAQQAWSQLYDPRSFALHREIKSLKPEEQKSAVNGLTPQQAKELMQVRKLMQGQ